MLPLFRPSCGDLEVSMVTEVLRSGWWGLGPETARFEKEFAQFVAAAHAVGVNSGTSALELAARVLAPKKTVAIVPSLTFVSTAQAMVHAGHEVIFADIDPETLTIDWNDVRNILSSIVTYAGENCRPIVVPVWYAGIVTKVPPDIFASSVVIEDCAHAAGSHLAGTQGLMSCWSFQAVKNLACGDGGMITTEHDVWARELRRLRWCGIDRTTWDRDRNAAKGYGWDYDVPGDGEKMHMNDIAAALGRAQLQQLPERNKRRRRVAREYGLAFMHLPWILLPPRRLRSSEHLYVIRVPADQRDRLIAHLIDHGVSAGVHYKPLTHYSKLFPGTENDTPVAECVWKELVTLPLFPDMTADEVQLVIDTVEDFPL